MLSAKALLKIENEEAADKLLAKTAANLELLENKTYFSGIDQYLPYFSKAYTSDYLPKQSLIIVSEPARVKEHQAVSAGSQRYHLRFIDQQQSAAKMVDVFIKWEELCIHQHHAHSLYRLF